MVHTGDMVYTLFQTNLYIGPTTKLTPAPFTSSLYSFRGCPVLLPEARPTRNPTHLHPQQLNTLRNDRILPVHIKISVIDDITWNARQSHDLQVQAHRNRHKVSYLQRRQDHR
jgi:hypothetical protein